MAMALPKLGEKKNCSGNCGNGIVENVKKKKLFWQLWQWHCRKLKKKNVLVIVAMALPKMEKKMFWQLWQWHC